MPDAGAWRVHKNREFYRFSIRFLLASASVRVIKTNIPAQDKVFQEPCKRLIFSVKTGCAWISAEEEDNLLFIKSEYLYQRLDNRNRAIIIPRIFRDHYSQTKIKFNNWHNLILLHAQYRKLNSYFDFNSRITFYELVCRVASRTK